MAQSVFEDHFASAAEEAYNQVDTNDPIFVVTVPAPDLEQLEANKKLMSVQDILFSTDNIDMDSVTIVKRALLSHSNLSNLSSMHNEVFANLTFTLDIQSILYSGVLCKMLVCRDITVLTQNTRLQQQIKQDERTNRFVQKEMITPASCVTNLVDRVKVSR